MLQFVDGMRVNGEVLKDADSAANLCVASFGLGLQASSRGI